MKDKKSIILFILLCIFFLFIYYSILNNEHFNNYCQSVDNTFISVSDVNDSRCVKNINNKGTLTKKSGLFDYIPCITSDYNWGIYHHNKCYPYPKKEIKVSELSYESGSSSEMSGEESKEVIKRRHKRDCEKQKLPNSGPCFSLEPFDNLYAPSQNCSEDNYENLSLDEQCQCIKNDNRYGFYKLQKIGNQGTLNCRKYYKSQNNDMNQTGIYSPNSYNVFVPTLSDSSLNMSDCRPKDVDFDQFCKIKNNNNSLYGTAKILNDEDGNCYKDDGTIDIHQANAICSYNYKNSIPKLSPGHSINSITLETTPYSPNYFTKCIPFSSDMNNSFQKECDSISNQYYPLKAYDIDSYDCPIGEGRAKCKFSN